MYYEQKHSEVGSQPCLCNVCLRARDAELERVRKDFKEKIKGMRKVIIPLSHSLHIPLSKDIEDYKQKIKNEILDDILKLL